MADMDVAPGVIPVYRAKIAAGEIFSDPAQAAAAERLQSLWVKLRGYDPKPNVGAAQQNGWVGKLLRRKQVDEAGEHPNGLYLVGDVGRGKSMLMDLFFAAADVPRKRRIHFHEFMQETHKRFHQIKQDPKVDDPIPVLADMIAGEAALLCFDEFQVHDIVDAMILGRLFEALFARLVVVVATSNTVPDDLFKGKPGRDAFLPFIGLLKKNLDVLVLEAARDYRRERVQGLRAWYVPANRQADAALEHVFGELTEGVPAKAEFLAVTGRRVSVPLAANGVAWFDFSALCGVPLGPGDYLALATHYSTVLIDGVPRLSPDNFDEARRFVTLVDALYEHRVKLYASAAALPDDLYKSGEGAAIFERTASRLVEMQSEEYLRLPHLT
jgi:cell division protein ZapE